MHMYSKLTNNLFLKWNTFTLYNFNMEPFKILDVLIQFVIYDLRMKWELCAFIYHINIFKA